jgi:hypothetical protein
MVGVELALDWTSVEVVGELGERVGKCGVWRLG